MITYKCLKHGDHNLNCCFNEAYISAWFSSKTGWFIPIYTCRNRPWWWGEWEV